MADVPPAAFADPRIIAGRRRVYRLTDAEVAQARATAADFAGSADAVESVTAFLHDALRPAYGLSGYRRGLLDVLDDGRGDCFESSAVAVMLLRSLGVPCRFVSEICASRFDPGAALAVLVPMAAAGPFTNSHVWLEAWVAGAWQPVDVQFGVCGRDAWHAARLQPRGGTFGFRFPVRLRSLDPSGLDDEDLAGPYLLAPFETQRECDAFRRWAEDIARFRDLRRDTPFLGARLTLMLWRLRRMARDLEALLSLR